MPGRFLVVDDDDSIRRLVSAVLRRQQYETDEARDGQEAIDKLTVREYDALFLDLMMPVCTGYEVLAFMRQRQISHKCVVVMTAAGLRGTKELDLTLVSRVLAKPFNISDVISAAEECYERASG
jgi:two-component system response regulator ResD